MTSRRNVSRLQRGFTLAEILVTTAIFAIIMIAALTVYDRSNKVFKSGTEAADLQQSTRIGFDKLVSDLRMAGFDYNRGGDPTGTGQFSQPDEQIEYAGPTAIVFRANFNYNTAAAQGNGLEPDYTPKDASGAAIFPYVTTSNDEIIIYALKSADSTKNTSTISFYADTDKPRTAYPPSGKEEKVTVTGIDTTNANPPYTLYRFTVTPNAGANTGVTSGTPVAENIRALHFFYYTDPQGTKLLQDPNTNADITTGHDASGGTFSTTYTVTLPDGTSTTYNTGAIGGDGQYAAANSNTTNVNDRSQRQLLQSIKVDLTGMNANPDANYTNPTETIGAIKSYRQYQLYALVIPRNFGLHGFPEPSYTPPGPPTITGMCVSACAAPVICWSPPSTGGPVLQYRIEWDTQSLGAFANAYVVTDPTATSVILPDDGVMDPSRTWLYHIIAQNDNGASQPSDLFSVQPKNATRPSAPGGFTASTATQPHSVNAANTDYAVSLQWTAPTTNDPNKSNAICSGNCAGSGSVIPPQENIRFRVARGVTSSFNPDAGEGVIVLDTATKGQPGPVAPGNTVSWSDAPKASLYSPGTCVQYYYRVQALDRCASSDTYNTSGHATDSVSDWSPAKTGGAYGGQAYDSGATVQASAPLVSIDSVNSVCPATGTCTIILNWAPVTTNTANALIGVDRYSITRYRKILSDTNYALDTTFGTAGTLGTSGASQSNSSTVSYRDAPPAADSNGHPYYYKYTVAANDCRLGVVSDPAYFPSSCTVNPVIAANGETNNTASGDTPAQAWLFNAGDTITVTPPNSSVTISSVQFDVYSYPDMTLVDSKPISSPSSFVYSWTDRTENAVYYVKITVTSGGTTPCKEVHVKYVQEQLPAVCAFVALSSAPLPSVTPPVTGNQDTAVATMTITNKSPDSMALNLSSYSLTFIDPDGNHNDITLVSTSWATTVNTWTDALVTPASPSTVPRFFPTVTPALNVAPNTNLTITVRWQYKKTDDPHSTPPATLSPSPLTKLCLAYTIASETGVTKSCNVVGQATNTKNPTSCD